MSRLMMIVARAGMLAAVFALAAGPARAHHSAAAYQNERIVLKDARVTKFVWANPHSILIFEATGPDGKLATWSAEAGSPSALPRIGWNRNSVKPGDVLTIAVYPARNGQAVGRLSRVIFPDGRELLDSQEGPGRLDDHR
jgi:hypothetical protein